MPGPVQIQGVQGFVKAEPEASAQIIHGSPVNPAHGSVGEVASPYPWEAYGGSWGHPTGPLGAENELLSDLPESQTFQAGQLYQDPSGDQTPFRTHAGVVTRGFYNTTDPVQSAEFRQQAAEAHAVDTGADRKARQSQNPLQDNWTGFYNVVPGEDMVPQIPGQVSAQANGFGSNDHTGNAYAKRNQFGYDSSHRHRRFAVNSVPGNYMWMRPGSRPMIKTLPGPARPAVGIGPFEGDNVGLAFGVDGAILQNPATEYVSPPQPYVAPATQAMSDESSPLIPLW